MSLPNHWMNAEGGGLLFSFLNMSGALLPSRPTFDRVIRTGVNGIGIWYTGKRGEPFGIETKIDCTSPDVAALTYAAYHASIMTKKDLYYSQAFWGTVLIHNVTLTGISRFQAAVGGVQNWHGGGGAILTASWTIESV